MLAILGESALRSLLLGGVVWIGLYLLRVRNPHVQMTSWVMVLVASLSMPLLMHWITFVRRHLSDMASGPSRDRDPRTLDCGRGCARERCHRRTRHLRFNHSASS
jgi:hypothetical protein